MTAIRIIALVACLLAGFTPRAATAADPANYLFALSSEHAEIAVIDGSSDQVIDRVAVPGLPSDLAALGRGRYLAVADKQGARIHIINVVGTHTQQSVAVPLKPDILRADRTGTTLAMLDRDDGRIASGAAGSSEFRLVPDIVGVTYLVFDAKGRILAAHPGGVIIVDATGQPTGELSVNDADGPVTDVATDPGGEYVFVEQPAGGVLSVFDLHDETRKAVLHLPAPLGRIIPSLDSQFVLVPTGGNALASVSTWTLHEKARIPLDLKPDIVELTFLQSIVAVVSRYDRKLLLYDLWKQKRAGEIHLPGRPAEGIPSSDGSRFYITLPATGQVASVNILTGQIDRLIDNVGLGVQTIVAAVGQDYCH